MNAALFWPIAWIALILCAVGLWLLGRSSFGTVLEGIRENEERMRFSGYDTYGPRLVAFIVSGAVASVGGALFALNAGYVSPETAQLPQGGRRPDRRHRRRPRSPVGTADRGLHLHLRPVLPQHRRQPALLHRSGPGPGPLLPARRHRGQCDRRRAPADLPAAGPRRHPRNAEGAGVMSIFEGHGAVGDAMARSRPSTTSTSSLSPECPRGDRAQRGRQVDLHRRAVRAGVR